jgi:hypothetical protein
VYNLPPHPAADINWRVSRPNGQFYQRSAKQQLIQNPDIPGKLRDTGGEFLHFADDWYILGVREAAGRDWYRDRDWYIPGVREAAGRDWYRDRDWYILGVREAAGSGFRNHTLL